MTKSEKGRDVILTRSVVRKDLQDAPQTFAEYPDQEERAKESMIAQVDQSQPSTGAEVPRQQVNNEPGSLVSMMIEVQPDGAQYHTYNGIAVAHGVHTVHMYVHTYMSHICTVQ